MRKRTQLLISVAATTLLGSTLAAAAFAQSPNGMGANGWHHGRLGHAPQGMMADQHMGVFGKVTTISGSTLTVERKGFGKDATTASYSVDASSAKVEKSGAAATLADIAVGDTVMVAGTVNGMSVTATMIRDGFPGRGDHPFGGAPTWPQLPPGNGQPVVMGTVSAISGSTLTVGNEAGVTYTVDATSAKVSKGGKDAALSDVATDDVVLVQGTVNGTSVTAASVIDQTFVRPAPASGTTTPPAHRAGFFESIHGFFSHLFGF